MSFGPAMLDVKELKLKDAGQNTVRGRIEGGKSIREGASTGSIRGLETASAVLGPFGMEVEGIVDDRMVRSSEESESYSTIIGSLYGVEISSLYCGLPLQSVPQETAKDKGTTGCLHYAAVCTL